MRPHLGPQVVHKLFLIVYPDAVTTRRLNVSLDEQRATKLARLADRAHVPDGTLARSLLSAAIDDADPDSASITEILEGIPGLPERLAQAEAEVEAGGITELENCRRRWHGS